MLRVFLLYIQGTKAPNSVFWEPSNKNKDLTGPNWDQNSGTRLGSCLDLVPIQTQTKYIRWSMVSIEVLLEKFNNLLSSVSRTGISTPQLKPKYSTYIIKSGVLPSLPSNPQHDWIWGVVLEEVQYGVFYAWECYTGWLSWIMVSLLSSYMHHAVTLCSYWTEWLKAKYNQTMEAFCQNATGLPALKFSFILHLKLVLYMPNYKALERNALFWRVGERAWNSSSSIKLHIKRKLT